MTDHRVDIDTYADQLDGEITAMLILHRAEGAVHPSAVGTLVGLGLPDDYNDNPAGYGEDYAHDLAESYFLSVEHTAQWFDNGTGSGTGFTGPETTTLLLAFGVPTVRLTWSHRYGTAELFHSWGMTDGVDRDTCVMGDHVGDFISTFFPHPCEV